jgi:SprT protein
MKLTQDQIRAVQLAVVAYVQKARIRYAHEFQMPVVTFDLRGTVGGKADIRNNYVKVNQTLCAENFDHYIKQTIGHEVAHLIAHALYPLKRIKPHGYEWQSVMRAFGLPADRCHSYDVSTARARTTTQYAYSCNCQVINVGAKVHRNMSIGLKSYHCRKCKGILKAGTSIGGSAMYKKAAPRQPTLSSLLDRHLRLQRDRF